MWLQRVPCDIFKQAIRSSSSMYLASKPKGEILWASDAFCQWSGYTVGELESTTWIAISESDDDLSADIRAANNLTPDDPTYTVQKKFRPKGGRPQIGCLHVTAFFDGNGEIEFCWCLWEPLRNGTAEAFELAISSQKANAEQLELLSAQVLLLHAQTEEEKFGLSAIRMAKKHPKIAMSLVIVMLVLTGFDGLLSTLQRLGFVPSPPVQVHLPERP